MWFQTMQGWQHNKLPTNFDFQFLLLGIDHVLDEKWNEHAVAIAKTLWFIYNNYVLFSSILKIPFIIKKY
jgi:hypothetical protein